LRGEVLVPQRFVARVLHRAALHVGRSIGDFRLLIVAALLELELHRRLVASLLVFPEQIEHTIEGLFFFSAGDQIDTQRETEIVALHDLDAVDGAEHVDHAPRRNVETGGLQQTAKLQHPAEQVGAVAR